MSNDYKLKIGRQYKIRLKETSYWYTKYKGKIFIATFNVYNGNLFDTVFDVSKEIKSSGFFVNSRDEVEVIEETPDDFITFIKKTFKL